MDTPRRRPRRREVAPEPEFATVKEVLLNLHRGALQPEFDDLLIRIAEEVVEHYSVNRCPSYPEVKKWKPRQRAELALYLTRKVVLPMRVLRSQDSHRWDRKDPKELLRNTAEYMMENLFRMKLEFADDELISILKTFHDNDPGPDRHTSLHFSKWPLGFVATQCEKHVKARGMSDGFRAFLSEAVGWAGFNTKNPWGWGPDVEKARRRLEAVLHDSSDDAGSVQPYRLSEDDVLGQHLNEVMDDSDPDLRDRLYEMFHHALTATSGKPSKKWLAAAKEIVSRTRAASYKDFVQGTLQFLAAAEVQELTKTIEWEGKEYTHTHPVFLEEKNALIVKGLAWSLSQFHDRATLEILARMAERSFKKIPEVGPTCAGVGNACIYSLASSRGLDGLSHLTRLKLRITQNNTRKLIQKYIDEAAQKLGITPASLEEMAVPDFGLTCGALEETFEDYTLKLSLTGTGKTALQWFTPEGKAQKSVPAFVKQSKKHSERLKKLRATAKQIQKYSTAQRDRIDRSYVDDRAWSYEEFLKFYHHHGLVSFIARRLIWVFEIDGEYFSALWHDDRWLDCGGEEVREIERTAKVRLWHPLLVEQKEVLEWRQRLEDWQLQQPMKQAYREVYLLTEAELATNTYSNRMAAHLLKQHQFNALAGIRAWKYSLLGAYDDGRDGETATLPLPAHGLVAEYWIDLLHIDDAFNDAGIYDYVATDQVRFVKRDGDRVLELTEVPKLVFSEVMRDVDLFVGVCSVGNDPEWQDRGETPQHRDYWTTYSFGDLTEIAKTRQAVLERLLPRLKFRDTARIDGRFLRIKGTVREYKIHIGSTNILMEPNDQYFCIVPARGADRAADKVFLPFEGDRGLSLLLSKAALLAEDDKITDPVILSQIGS